MSEELRVPRHTTHFDDCGCLSASLRKDLDRYRGALERIYKCDFRHELGYNNEGVDHCGAWSIAEEALNGRKKGGGGEMQPVTISHDEYMMLQALAAVGFICIAALCTATVARWLE